MNKPTILLLITAALIFVACNTKKMSEDELKYNLVEFDDPFKMTQKKGVKMKGDDMILVFNKIIEDSRCPEGATCVWEGQIKMELLISTAKGDQKIEMTRKGKQKENAMAEVEGRKIYWTVVNPYPVEGDKIEQQDYSVTLIVKK